MGDRWRGGRWMISMEMIEEVSNEDGNEVEEMGTS